MADLTDFYPKSQNPSPNGAGAPAAPASVKGASTSIAGSPALWTLVLVGAALVLLHHA